MTSVSGNEFADIIKELKALSARVDNAKAAAEARTRAIATEASHDAMTVGPDVGLTGLGSLAAELEALSARVDMARAAADARARATATRVRYLPVPSPITPTVGRGPRSRSRRLLILALVLVLAGIAATIVVASDDGPDTPVSRPPAVPEPTAAVDRPSPTATGVPATGIPSPSAPAPGDPVPAPSSATAPVPPPPEDALAPDTATTVIVESGTVFGGSAAHRVASVNGSAPTEAEVASWVTLVEANRSQLAHDGNPDLIYPGQTFSLP